MRITIALLLLATAAHAGSNEVSIGTANRALRTNSANAVTDSSLGTGQLGYARALDIDVIPDLDLWARAGFEWGGVDGTMFQTLSTRVETQGFTIGARARYALLSWIDATARLDLGTARAKLTIKDDAGHSARDDGWGVLTEAAAGLDIYALHRPRLTLGFRVELGYVATSSIGLTATPESPSEGTLQLQMTAAALGGLDLSGPVFAAAFVGQF